MKPKLIEWKGIIREFIQGYFKENDNSPSEKEISNGIGGLRFVARCWIGVFAWDNMLSVRRR